MKMPNPDRTSRREFIKAGAFATAALGANGSVGCASYRGGNDSLNPVARENRKPGTMNWMLGNPRVTPPDPLWHMFGLRCPWVEGYCSHASVAPGETLSIYVSTEPESRWTLDVYRMGYYGGKGGRLKASFGPFPGRTQPAPQPGANRVIQCQWESSLEIGIPDDWLSGVYLGKLRELREGAESYVIFIVRDERPVDFLFQCSDMTWQAYNRWPSQYSLYCNGRLDNHTGSGVDVSVDRPYGKYTQLVDQPLSTGSGEWFLWEFPLAYWMEQQGCHVGYISNWDAHYRPSLLRKAKGFLSVGHDEYWTPEMFGHVRDAIDSGLNAAFLSGNSVFCKIKLKPGRDGRPDRIFERDGRFQPRENTLMGSHSTGPVIGGADWICRRPGHWLFQGSGMREGDGIPGLVGWEFHGDPAPIEGLEVVASGATDSNRHPLRDPEPGRQGEYAATIYPGPEGNFVFNAATCWWTDGLSEPPGYRRSSWYAARSGPDVRVQQITANLLDRFRR